MGLCILLDLFILSQDSFRKINAYYLCSCWLYVSCSCSADLLLDTSICCAKVFTYKISFKGLMEFCVCFQAPKDACGPDQSCSGMPAVLLCSLSSGSLNRKSKQMSV